MSESIQHPSTSISLSQAQTSPDSLMAWLSSQPVETQTAFFLKATTAQRVAASEAIDRLQLKKYEFVPLDHQLIPDGDWFIWVMQWGAGAGKTYRGVQYVRAQIDAGTWRTVNVAGPTWVDTIRTMVRGSEEAPGLMGVWPPHQRPEFRGAKDDPHLICHNGAKIQLFAAQKAERFRGPAADGAWFDEIDAWMPERMTREEAFALAEQRIRTGPQPCIICTTTPKRTGLVKALVARNDCAVTRATMYDNAVNLSPIYVRAMEERYGGTRLGRQELLGEILPDVEGAIVSLEMIDEHRWTEPEAPECERVVIGVDPYGGGGDSCGIVAAGKRDDQAIVLHSEGCKKGPEGWGRRVMEVWLEHEADCVAIETNYGGNMCVHVVTSAAKLMGLPAPRFAGKKRKGGDVGEGIVSTKAKHIRFARITGAKYERGEVRHVGTFETLEDEVTQFTPQGYEGDSSPNEADAEVFAIEELFPLKRRMTFADMTYPHQEKANGKANGKPTNGSGLSV